MLSGPTLLAALNAAAFLLCVAFLAYVVMIIVPYLRHRPGEPGDAAAFDWHLLIPALDEQYVIEATVVELRRSFPDAHLWVVDDASADRTPAIVQRLATELADVHVVTRELPEARQGKGPALNAGYRAIAAFVGDEVDSDRVIVGVVDADARLDPACCSIVAGDGCFGDPAVGAVQIEVRVTDHLDAPGGPLSELQRDSMLIRLQDLEFAGPIAGMQLLRRKVDSVGMGGNGQFSRLSVLREIGGPEAEPWHGALLEDFELGIHVLLAGHRNEYCHDTWVAQEGLKSLRPLLRQRSRWSQGSMQCIRYLWPVMRSMKVSTAGALEIAYFLCLPWLQLIGGLVYSGVTAVALYYLATSPGGFMGWFRGGAWGILPLFLLFGLAPFMIWGPIHKRRNAPNLSWPQAFATAAVNVGYTYFHHLAVWWAFIRLVASRHDWKKTERLVPRLAHGPLPGFARRLAGGFSTRGSFARRRPTVALRPAVASPYQSQLQSVYPAAALAAPADESPRPVLVTGRFARRTTITAPTVSVSTREET
ncbi:MAG TPA: glycosyltransferase [Acidimicrobiales bacterium]|nr:glycosyltransferase [Acidimicrobiales bacterium]